MYALRHKINLKNVRIALQMRRRSKINWIIKGIINISFFSLFIINGEVSAQFSGGDGDGSTMARLGSSGGEVPLPVEILSLNANPSKGIVGIAWSTASEFNSNYFLVQRTKDGNTFENAGRVNASGNCSTVKKYSFEDCEPYYGVSYYRLKEVDNDGKFQYSKVIAVHFDDHLNGMIVFPNPTSGPFNISFTDENKKQILIVMRDIQGNHLYSQVLPSSEENEVFAIIPSAKLKSGLYFISAFSNNKVFEKKIIVK